MNNLIHSRRVTFMPMLMTMTLLSSIILDPWPWMLTVLKLFVVWDICT